jgi:3-methyladenine DNA glycosylase AlkD
MTSDDVIAELKKQANRNPKDLAGMARFGINTENTLCLTMGKLDTIAKVIKKESPETRHKIALEIWESGIREARILAGRIDVPALVTSEQMEKWVKGFNSWDVCDNTIMKDFSYSAIGWEKAIPWSKRKEEYVKRAGFVMMAMLAMHDKKAPDERFYPFLDRIKEEATDERNFVRKAVNWALRTIGKSRTKNLYKLALEKGKEIADMDNKTARWIAKDAIRELTTSKYILKRFGNE